LLSAQMPPWRRQRAWPAVLCLGALSGLSSAQGPRRSCVKGCCLLVSVLQRHTRPTFQKAGSSIKDSHFDEVTVEFKPCDRVATMELRLPERQQCEGAAESSRCTGYSFRQTGNGGCYLKRSRVQALPSNQEIKAIDVVSAGHLTDCAVDNHVGDGGLAVATPKRSRASLDLQAPVIKGEAPPWQFFTILVQNPPRTPEGKDVLGNVANSFQIVLKSDNGTVLGSVAYPAKEIRSMWFCSYSDWVLTSPCTAKCGGGLRYKVRKRLHPPPPDYDPAMLNNCDEQLSASEPCNQIECDADCKLGDWVRWGDGECTATCGGGWETQRRLVIEGPSGNGKPCPHWSTEGVRVRYKPCNIHACEPRCEKAAEQYIHNYSLRMETSCTVPCGGGTRAVLFPASRKETGIPDARCAVEHRSACNTKPCQTLNLFPGKPSLLPWAGHWFDLSIVFFLSDLTDALELHPPVGFDLGKGKCKLIEHNLPRMKSCMVTSLDGNQQMATFEFFNPLEALRDGKGNVMYKMRIWVKHPTDCPGGVTPEGICRGGEGERDWSLIVRTDLPTTIWETISAGYEIYQPGAVPDVKKTVRHRDMAKVTVTEKPEEKQRRFKSKEQEEQDAAEAG